MQIIDLKGVKFTASVFIDLYASARKLAPPRFMTMRLHPDRYDELYTLADIPESIQVGPTRGPMGRIIMRVACIKPPLGVEDGIAIDKDMECPKDQVVFSIHGMDELIYQGLGPIVVP